MTEKIEHSITVKQSTEAPPGTGGQYARRAEVEAQIIEVSSFNDQQIYELLNNRQRESNGYLLDETIVYLLSTRRDDDFFRDTLYAELNRRIWKLLRKFYKKIDNQADFEDFGQTVEMTIIRSIFGEAGGGYAQFYFGDFVVKTATYAWYARLKNQKRDESMFDAERPADDGASESDENRFQSTDMSPEEKLILRSRLAELPESIRHVAILHYLDGWQIESKDAMQPTVSKLFNVSSRTIRNWLKEARDILTAQQDQGGQNR